jgi:hypothetical protein
VSQNARYEALDLSAAVVEARPPDEGCPNEQSQAPEVGKIEIGRNAAEKADADRQCSDKIHDYFSPLGRID